MSNSSMCYSASKTTLLSSKMKVLAPLLFLFAAADSAVGFTSISSPSISQRRAASLLRSGNDESESSRGVVSVDVSYLGLTIADLEKKIPIHNFSVESSMQKRIAHPWSLLLVIPCRQGIRLMMHVCLM